MHHAHQFGSLYGHLGGTPAYTALIITELSSLEQVRMKIHIDLQYCVSRSNHVMFRNGCSGGRVGRTDLKGQAERRRIGQSVSSGGTGQADRRVEGHLATSRP